MQKINDKEINTAQKILRQSNKTEQFLVNSIDENKQNGNKINCK